jgi:hypothetical protein
VNDRSTRDHFATSEASGSAAYEQLVRQHYEHVFAVCYGILVNVCAIQKTDSTVP